LTDGHRPNVLIDVFAESHAFLGGIDDAVAIVARGASPRIETKVTPRDFTDAAAWRPGDLQ
jgi:hypothetical protein